MMSRTAIKKLLEPIFTGFQWVTWMWAYILGSKVNGNWQQAMAVTGAIFINEALFSQIYGRLLKKFEEEVQQENSLPKTTLCNILSGITFYFVDTAIASKESKLQLVWRCMGVFFADGIVHFSTGKVYSYFYLNRNLADNFPNDLQNAYEAGVMAIAYDLGDQLASQISDSNNIENQSSRMAFSSLFIFLATASCIPISRFVWSAVSFCYTALPCNAQREDEEQSEIRDTTVVPMACSELPDMTLRIEEVGNRNSKIVPIADFNTVTVLRVEIQYNNELLREEQGLLLIKFVNRNFGSKAVDLLLDLTTDQFIAEQILLEVKRQGMEAISDLLFHNKKKILDTANAIEQPEHILKIIEEIKIFVGEKELNELSGFSKYEFNALSYNYFSTSAKQMIQIIGNLVQFLDNLLDISSFYQELGVDTRDQITIVFTRLACLFEFVNSNQNFVNFVPKPSHLDSGHEWIPDEGDKNNDSLQYSVQNDFIDSLFINGSISYNFSFIGHE